MVAQTTCMLQMIMESSIDDILVRFGGCLFRQFIGIPMWPNCASSLADIFLYPHENELLPGVSRKYRRLINNRTKIYRLISEFFLFWTKHIPSEILRSKSLKSVDNWARYTTLRWPFKILRDEYCRIVHRPLKGNTTLRLRSEITIKSFSWIDLNQSQHVLGFNSEWGDQTSDLFQADTIHVSCFSSFPDFSMNGFLFFSNYIHVSKYQLHTGF